MRVRHMVVGFMLTMTVGCSAVADFALDKLTGGSNRRGDRLAHPQVDRARNDSQGDAVGRDGER